MRGDDTTTMRRVTFLHRRGLLVALIGLALVGLRANRLIAAGWNNAAARALNSAQSMSNLTASDRYARTVNAGNTLVQALRFDRTFSKPYTNLGIVYAELSDATAATQALSDAVRIAPRDWRAQFFLGQALAGLGHETEARAAWQAAGAASYFVHQADDLRTIDPEASRLAGERAIAAAPGRSDGYLSLGKTLSAQKDITGALAIYQEALVLTAGAPDEDLAAVHYEIGVLLHRDFDRIPEALAALEMAASLDPEREATRLELAAIVEKRGACYEAESWLEPLLRHPSSPAQGARAAVVIGRCLLTAGRAEAAVAHLERAIAADPTSVSHRLLLAQAYRAAGRMEAAVDAYEQVLVLSPDNAAAAKALAELQEPTP